MTLWTATSGLQTQPNILLSVYACLTMLVGCVGGHVIPYGVISSWVPDELQMTHDDMTSYDIIVLYGVIINIFAFALLLLWVYAAPKNVQHHPSTQVRHVRLAECQWDSQCTTFAALSMTQELVVFPSWLVHRVEPSGVGGHGARVSVSCNVPGDWGYTSDLNMAI